MMLDSQPGSLTNSGSQLLDLAAKTLAICDARPSPADVFLDVRPELYETAFFSFELVGVCDLQGYNRYELHTGQRPGNQRRKSWQARARAGIPAATSSSCRSAQSWSEAVRAERARVSATAVFVRLAP
jgi:hypothetical protein